MSTTTQSKVREVYRCDECDQPHETPLAAVNCCPPPGLLKEYECLYCGFVWKTLDEAQHCFRDDIALGNPRGKDKWKARQ